MTNKLLWSGIASVASVSAALCVSMVHAPAGVVLASDKPAPAVKNWSPAAAAAYLDGRETWWQGWNRAQKDHGTLCVSCHTQAPYALARPVLRNRIGEHGPTAQEQVMLASVEKRVRAWKNVKPFYSDATYGAGKEVESRNAEAVLNAFILTGYDAAQEHLSERTRLAFDNAWALQLKSGPDAGAWVWQNFDYTPWESKESQYHWAALMAVALGSAPDAYMNDKKVGAHVVLLRGYLQSHYEAQPLVNKTVALWASHWFPEIISTPQREALLDILYSLQSPNGGWSLTSLGAWSRRDKTPLETRPDGYATGLITLILEQTGPTSVHEDPLRSEHVQRGRHWLIANQDNSTGAWPAWSLNKNRDPKSDAGMFMSDAATSYAVLALENQR